MIPDIHTAKLKDLTTNKFYNDYLTKSFPIKVTDGCANWKALEEANIKPKWKYDYLIKQLLSAYDEYNKIP